MFQAQTGFQSEESTKGGTQIRTGDKGFAGPCLTTWPCRQRSRLLAYHAVVSLVDCQVTCSGSKRGPEWRYASLLDYVPPTKAGTDKTNCNPVEHHKGDSIPGTSGRPFHKPISLGLSHRQPRVNSWLFSILFSQRIFATFSFSHSSKQWTLVKHYQRLLV